VERSWKIGGCGREKVHSRYAGGGGLCKVNGKVKAWDRYVLGNVEGVAGKCVGNCLWVCELGSYMGRDTESA
jgi:hypothetical protein